MHQLIAEVSVNVNIATLEQNSFPLPFAVIFSKEVHSFKFTEFIKMDLYQVQSVIWNAASELPVTKKLCYPASVQIAQEEVCGHHMFKGYHNFPLYVGLSC